MRTALREAVIKIGSLGRCLIASWGKGVDSLSTGVEIVSGCVIFGTCLEAYPTLVVCLYAF